MRIEVASAFIATLLGFSFDVGAQQKLTIEAIESHLQNTAAEALGLTPDRPISSIQPKARSELNQFIHQASVILYRDGADDTSLKKAQNQLRGMMEQLLVDSASTQIVSKVTSQKNHGRKDINEWNDESYKGIIKITNTALAILIKNVCPVYPFCPPQ
jgi:hypothetical protein